MTFILGMEKKKTQSNSFSSVSTYRQMYGQLVVDYERQFGKHKFKASVLGDTRNTLTNWDLPEYPSNIIGDVSYDYAGRYFAQVALSEKLLQSLCSRQKVGNLLCFRFRMGYQQREFYGKL